MDNQDTLGSTPLLSPCRCLECTNHQDMNRTSCLAKTLAILLVSLCMVVATVVILLNSEYGPSHTVFWAMCVVAVSPSIHVVLHMNRPRSNNDHQAQGSVNNLPTNDNDQDTADDEAATNNVTPPADAGANHEEAQAAMPSVFWSSVTDFFMQFRMSNSDNEHEDAGDV